MIAFRILVCDDTLVNNGGLGNQTAIFCYRECPIAFLRESDIITIHCKMNLRGQINVGFTDN